MNPIQRVGGDEGEPAREQLEQRDAERVQVAARIDRAVHSAGLLRGHVGKRPGQNLRRLQNLAFPWRQRRAAEAGEEHPIAGIDENIRGFDVFVNQPTGVRLRKDARDRDGQRQEFRQLTALTDAALERLTAGILQKQHVTAFAASQCQRPGGPPGLELGG